MDDPTIVTVTTARPESGQPNEPSSEPIRTDEVVEDVATVADEILVEVKECRTRQDQLLVDLTHLREAGSEATAREQELLTELRNLREESRNLQAELKALLESRNQNGSEVSPSSTLSTSPEIPAVVVIDPASEEEGRAAPPTKKKKRYKI